MDHFLDMCISNSAPALNPLLANGVAVTQLKNAPAFIESAIRSASKSFVDGLVYVGSARCTPQEEYAFLIARGKSRRMFDIARSDYYMMKYRFSYQGEALKDRYVYLPFVGDAGYITLRGAKHLISPTLNDIVFSVTNDSVFVRLQRDRFRFQRLQHGFVVNGNRSELASVIWSQIHKKATNKPAVNGHATAVHYLLAKYGFEKAFELFSQVVPVIGEGREITEQTHPQDKWVILSSANLAPAAVAKLDWKPSQIKLAVPIESYRNNVKLKAMIGGFFYIVDHFPDRVKARWVNYERLWKILMGKFIHSAETNEGVMAEKINEHMRSIDDYMDLHVIRQLREIGYDIEDFYQLLSLLIERFNEWLSLSSDQINSMNGKELNVNGFTLFPITAGIFRTVYSINQRFSTRRTITAADINRAFDRFFKPTAIFSITSKNAEVSSLTTSNDNKALRLTAIIVPQTPNERSGSGPNLDDPAIRLHPSIAEFGGYTNLRKRHPDGRSTLNHCAIVDENFRLMRNPDFIPLLDQTQELTKFR